MADEPEKSGQEPNLELPSLLGFGRKKKRQRDPVPDEPVTEELPVDQDPLAADPVAEPRGGLAPSAEKPKRRPPVPPPTRAVAPPVKEPVPEPVAPVVEPETVVEPEPVVVEAEPAVVTQEAETEQTIVLPTEAPLASEPPVEFVAPAYGEESATTTAPPLALAEEADRAPDEEPARARTARSVKLPVISPRLAAFVTGALIGLVGVALYFLAARGCEAVRGVGSCGGIGLFALLVILAIQVLLGAAVLGLWRVQDAVSTSFLGVGLVAVFVLLFLLGSLESVWMFAVIPVLTGLTFVLSWWVTTALVEDVSSGAERR